MAVSMWKVMRNINISRISVFSNALNFRTCFNRHLTLQTKESHFESEKSDDVDGKSNENDIQMHSYTDLDTGATVTEQEVKPEPRKSFAALFRNSPFVQLGDLQNKIIAGRIHNVVGDDLYVEFGGKFMCVCQRPSHRPEEYVRGKRVRVYLHAFEMAAKFMGSDKAVTLLEADCTLLGLFEPTPREKHRPRIAEDGQTMDRSSALEGLSTEQSIHRLKQMTGVGESDKVSFELEDIFNDDDDAYGEEYPETRGDSGIAKDLGQVKKEGSAAMAKSNQGKVNKVKFDEVLSVDNRVADKEAEDFHEALTKLNKFQEQDKEETQFENEKRSVAKTRPEAHEVQTFHAEAKEVGRVASVGVAPKKTAERMEVDSFHAEPQQVGQVVREDSSMASAKKDAELTELVGKDSLGPKGGKPSGGKDGKPSDGKDGKPSGGKDGKPSGGKDGKQSGGKDGKPSGGKDGKPNDGKDGKPSGGKDGKPSGGKDGKPSGGKDGKPSGGKKP